jgi:hypothetical protein
VRLAQEWGRNAYVDSVCRDDWNTAFGALAGRILQPPIGDFACLASSPPFDGATCTSACLLLETLDDARPCPADPMCPQAWCPAASPETLASLRPCRDPATEAECVPLKRDLGTILLDGLEHRRCLVRQVPRDPLAFRCGMPLGQGWYYLPEAWSSHGCPELAFSSEGPESLLELGSSAVLRCPR